MKRQLRTDTIYLIRLVCIVFLTGRCVVVVFFSFGKLKKIKWERNAVVLQMNLLARVRIGNSFCVCKRMRGFSLKV